LRLEFNSIDNKLFIIRDLGDAENAEIEETAERVLVRAGNWNMEVIFS
jgi:hypothetical protein